MSKDGMDTTGGGSGGSPLLYALAPAIIVGLALVHWLFPDFYVERVLSRGGRERQVVEIVTFASAFVGGVLMLWAAARLWRAKRQRSGAAIIVIIAAATLFFAGEEISWGQSYFGWQTPAELDGVTPETNLHNIHDLRMVFRYGPSLFLICMFLVLPIAWTLDRDDHLPRGWTPAIASWPIVVCMVVAFVWRDSKKLYLLAFSDDGEDGLTEAHRWYWDFFEQVPEQKEMLVAIALLMYGLACMRRS
jgi:Na+/melibiose symporter-like transporter